MNKINDASLYFNEFWQKYQNSINNNTLYHQEMRAALDKFLTGQFGNSAFDAAPDVLKLAEKNLSAINCEKVFICDNMINAIAEFH